jgi:hypothetical protein
MSRSAAIRALIAAAAIITAAACASPTAPTGAQRTVKERLNDGNTQDTTGLGCFSGWTSNSSVCG